MSTEPTFLSDPNLDYNYRLLLKQLLEQGAQLERLGLSPVVVGSYKKQSQVILDLSNSQTSFVANWLASDKFYTKQFLASQGFSVPAGKVFNGYTREAALAYAQELGLPIVIKPVTDGHGNFVYSQLESESEVIQAIDVLVKDRGEAHYFLVEKHVFGQEYRIFITNQGFMAVVHRIPARVIGDGENSILGLIQIENFTRMNPRTTCLCEIKLDDILFDYLDKQNLDMDFVPNKGQSVTLRPTSNVSKGGSCFDVTNEVHPDFTQLAQSILNAIPDLSLVGIDLLCQDITQPLKDQSYAICELNPNPGLSLHMQPEAGQAYNAAAAVAKVIFKEPV